MKPIRFSEEQIIAVLREHEAGAKTADLARKHGVSEATLYNWKARYGGLDESFNGRMRDELLNETLFLDLDQARQLIGAWTADYNTARPHSSLEDKTPTAYAKQLTASTGAKPAEALIAAG